MLTVVICQPMVTMGDLISKKLKRRPQIQELAGDMHNLAMLNQNYAAVLDLHPH